MNLRFSLISFRVFTKFASSFISRSNSSTLLPGIAKYFTHKEHVDVAEELLVYSNLTVPLYFFSMKGTISKLTNVSGNSVHVHLGMLS